MSLNKFSSTEIKPYLKVGCSELNTNLLKLNGNPIKSGYYIPNITVQEGGNFTNTICRYTIIDKIMTLSLVGLFETGSSSSAYSFDVSIPSGYELDNTIDPNVFSGVATLTPAITGVAMVSVNVYPAGNNVFILMKNFSTAFPASTFCNLNAVLTCSIKHL